MENIDIIKEIKDNINTKIEIHENSLSYTDDEKKQFVKGVITGLRLILMFVSLMKIKFKKVL